MIFTDAAEVSQRRRTKDGYMVVDAHVARVGIQKYLGVEVGKPEMAMVAVYRPEEEVFSADAINSYAHRPVTIGHPPQGVTAANWRDVARGSVGGDIVRDGGRVRVPMIIMDQAAIAEVEAGTREISMGYHCRLEFADGVTPQGEPYQAIQRDLRMNHAAIVPKGRAGAECRISDSWADFADGGTRDPDQSQPRPTADRDTPSMHKLTIDGITVDLSDTAREVVSKALSEKATLLSDNLKLIADHAAALKAKDTAHAEVVNAKDKELATKDAEIEKLKANQLDDAKIDALAAERGEVIGTAKTVLDAAKARGVQVADLKTAGVPLKDIRRSVVATVLGDAAIKDKPDAYVDARFEIMAEDAAKRPDQLGRAISDSLPNPPANPQGGGHNVVQLGDAATEYARMQERDRNAWKMGA